jgi:predicted DCC family thiol-disulfide oxidoreductase YuxK
MNKPEPDPSLCVLYDGDCPLCSREIGWYQKRGADERIRWINLRDAGLTSLPAGIGRDAALARFHVVQADGAVVSGAAAFVRLWQAYPGLRLAARLLSRPLPLAVLERAYRLFLPIRPALARLLPRRARPASHPTETPHDE